MSDTFRANIGNMINGLIFNGLYWPSRNLLPFSLKNIEFIIAGGSASINSDWSDWRKTSNDNFQRLAGTSMANGNFYGTSDVG